MNYKVIRLDWCIIQTGWQAGWWLSQTTLIQKQRPQWSRVSIPLQWAFWTFRTWKRFRNVGTLGWECLELQFYCRALLSEHSVFTLWITPEACAVRARLWWWCASWDSGQQGSILLVLLIPLFHGDQGREVCLIIGQHQGRAVTAVGGHLQG